MSNPTRRYLTDVAIVACKEAQRPTLISATPEDDLTRAKRALWVAEEKFTQILRRNAQARFNSPRWTTRSTKPTRGWRLSSGSTTDGSGHHPWVFSG